MYEPPSSVIDLESDAEETPITGSFRPLEISGYGTISARKPQPAAVAMIAAAVRSKASAEFRNEALVMFIQAHMSADDFGEMMRRQITGEVPDRFSVGDVAEALATWGTARPTKPSRRSALRRLNTGAYSARS